MQAVAPVSGDPRAPGANGYAGVRCAKWSATITVRDRPSDNPI
jgi:hypothetical protein